MKMRAVYFAPAILLLIALVFACSRSRNAGEIIESGTIEGIDVNVSSKVSGNALKLLVDEGSVVRAGDPIAEIDDTIYQLQLNQSLANLEMAKANLKVVTENYQSTLKLYRQGTSTEKQKQDLKSRYKVAMAQLDAAKAGVDLAQQALQYCHISAPVDGVVTHKLVETGELVGPGTPVFTITELNPVRLMVYVTEKELGKVKIGQDADVSIDSYPDRFFPGRVIYISPVAEFTPKNVQTKEERVKLVFGVKIEIPNPEGILKPGMPADAAIKTGETRTK